MAILLPRKPTLICLLVLNTICLMDGIVKRDAEEILVTLALLIYVIVSLITGRKKNGP